jgi:two-component system sensor histidine kinase KdpD
VSVSARQRGEWIEVAVSDEGAGLLPFERHAIFEPFRRGEGSNSSGVGLAICKSIIESHGGMITVDGAPSGGARFSFTVPVHRE